MAQVWVTYKELADLCGCTISSGQAHAKRWRWAERASTGGVLHVQLPDDLGFDFMRRSTLHGLTEQVANRNVADLAAVTNKALRGRVA